MMSFWSRMNQKLLQFLGLAHHSQDQQHSTWRELPGTIGEAEADVDVRPSSRSVQKESNVISLHPLPRDTPVILAEPTSYDEAADIADKLSESKYGIVLNVQRLDLQETQRVVDFLSGSMYALGGEVQKIGEDLYLCTPPDVHIRGPISDLLPEEFKSRMR